MRMEKIYCDLCGNEIIPGNDDNGLPAGVGFQTLDGGMVNVCRDCVIKRGREMSDYAHTNGEDVVDR